MLAMALLLPGGRLGGLGGGAGGVGGSGEGVLAPLAVPDGSRWGLFPSSTLSLHRHCHGQPNQLNMVGGQYPAFHQGSCV